MLKAETPWSLDKLLKALSCVTHKLDFNLSVLCAVPAAEGYNPEAPAISLQPTPPIGLIPGLPPPQSGMLGAPPMPPAPPGVMMGQRPPFGPPINGMPPLGPPPGINLCYGDIFRGRSFS